MDQKELDFDFDRPARFIDMEGGEAILADPSLIARNYREAVKQYMTEIDDLIRTTAIDYHRVKLHEKYDARGGGRRRAYAARRRAGFFLKVRPSRARKRHTAP